jgi:5-methylcytosine-specific restriction endonuclease McrA
MNHARRSNKVSKNGKILYLIGISYANSIAVLKLANSCASAQARHQPHDAFVSSSTMVPRFGRENTLHTHLQRKKSETLGYYQGQTHWLPCGDLGMLIHLRFIHLRYRQLEPAEGVARARRRAMQSGRIGRLQAGKGGEVATAMTFIDCERCRRRSIPARPRRAVIHREAVNARCESRRCGAEHQFARGVVFRRPMVGLFLIQRRPDGLQTLCLLFYRGCLRKNISSEKQVASAGGSFSHT